MTNDELEQDYQELKQSYLDLLQEVLDAKDIMLAEGCERASFAEMFKQFVARKTLAEPVQESVALADEVIGCFHAAECEGLTEALANTTDEHLKDLVERRLMHALYAAQEAKEKK
jgi:Ni,Fe-hydrogenase I small subunit